eukprot:175292-Pelagomonas_calceolata.AAC.1
MGFLPGKLLDKLLTRGQGAHSNEYVADIPATRTNFWYPLRNRRGNREHSAPATATPPASK